MQKLIGLILFVFFLTSHLFSQIQFSKHIIDPSNNRVTSVSPADINDDNLIDLVVCERLNNKITLWQNHGGNNLTFSKLVIDSTFNLPMYLCVQDLNNDNKLDIIASSATNGTIGVWLNKSTDTYQWDRFILTTDFPEVHAVFAYDIDCDGDVDIAASCGGNTNQIAWWENNGDNIGNWNKHIIAEKFYSSQTLAIVDIDKDNRPDILAGSSSGNQIAWFKNALLNDTITWTKFIIGTNIELPHWVTYADIDNDNDIDIIAAGYSSTEISYWQNLGGDTIHWQKKFISSSFSSPLTVLAADFNNDGYKDVVATSFGGDKIGLWINNTNTTGNWDYNVLGNNYNGAWALCSCDLDNDGDMDIITGADVLSGSGISANLSWWENNFIIDNIHGNNIQKYNFNLEQNYPNPFNPDTRIKFSLPHAGTCRVKIFNLLGELIKLYSYNNMESGDHEVSFKGNNLASGIYLYKLESGSFVSTKKLVLMR